ncbi:MAG: hypothetical protein ACQESR_13960 [Planctomycetota bacterium]
MNVMSLAAVTSGKAVEIGPDPGRPILGCGKQFMVHAVNSGTQGVKRVRHEALRRGLVIGSRGSRHPGPITVGCPASATETGV